VMAMRSKQKFLKLSVAISNSADQIMRIVSLCFFLLVVGSAVHAQTIPDDVKLSFGEHKSIKIDIDGDGKPDTIQARVYALVPGCTKERPLNSLTFSAGLRLISF